MNIFVTVLTLAAVFASSEAGPQGRITNGRNADQREFVFHVGISEYPGEEADIICGGVIISNYWVLTAAHCVENLEEVTLHFGSNNFFNPEFALTVPENCITKHPAYNSYTQYNDIALINTTYIEFTQNINKVSLPSMSVDVGCIATNLIVNAIGWGKDEHGDLNPYNLKVTHLRAISNEACRPFLNAAFNNDKTICAMTINGSVCEGDSGGGLVLQSNKVLLGISSFVVSTRCNLGLPVAFVRVTEYLDWIKDVSGVFKP